MSQVLFVCKIDETLGFEPLGEMVMDENKGTVATTPAPADDAFKAALHTKLMAVAARPIEPRMLLELEQSARLARQFLMVSADPHALRRMRFGQEFGSAGDGVIAGEMLAAPAEMTGGQEVTGAFSSAPKSETFGVTVIRELVAALSLYNKPSEPANKGLSAGDLAYGITIAKESNMPDVETKLRKRLALMLGDMTEEDGSPRVVDAPVAAEQGAAA